MRPLHFYVKHFRSAGAILRSPAALFHRQSMERPTLGDEILPVAGPVVAVLLVLLAAVMTWDLLAAYGRVRDPESWSRKHGFAGFWLLREARFGVMRDPDKSILWRRVIIVWALAALMLWGWFSGTFAG